MGSTRARQNATRQIGLNTQAIALKNVPMHAFTEAYARRPWVVSGPTGFAQARRKCGWSVARRGSPRHVRGTPVSGSGLSFL